MRRAAIGLRERIAVGVAANSVGHRPAEGLEPLWRLRPQDRDGPDSGVELRVEEEVRARHAPQRVGAAGSLVGKPALQLDDRSREVRPRHRPTVALSPGGADRIVTSADLVDHPRTKNEHLGR
jgi:hypothetical protein